MASLGLVSVLAGGYGFVPILRLVGFGFGIFFSKFQIGDLDNQ
jgi:hypothetical protein